MPKEKGPEWNYVTVQTNDRPNIQTYALCILRLLLVYKRLLSFSE